MFFPETSLAPPHSPPFPTAPFFFFSGSGVGQFVLYSGSQFILCSSGLHGDWWVIW
jgi:hypothetical protein